MGNFHSPRINAHPIVFSLKKTVVPLYPFPVSNHSDTILLITKMTLLELCQGPNLMILIFQSV